MLREHFDKADSDENGGLTVEEFRTLPFDENSERGEFTLLAKNMDQKLTLTEFQTAAAVEQKQQLKRAFHFYDADNDNILSVDEYLKRGEGLEVDPLTAFRRRDEDLDGLLTSEEFQYTSSAPAAVERAEQHFVSADANSDGRLTFEEFVKTPEGRPDSVSRFAFRDADSDGLLGLAEFTRGMAWRRLRLHEAIHSGYDLDGDGQLSLEEFRQTPEMQPIGALIEIEDANADGKLSFREFRAYRQGVQLTRAETHFERFDANSDGILDISEFPVSKHPNADKRPGCTDPELAFLRLDSDGNAALSVDEFLNREPGDDDHFRERLQHWQETAPDIFVSLDGDGNGALSLAEFTPSDFRRDWVVADGELLRPRQGELFHQTRFLSSDQDGDGKLTVEEYVSKLKDKVMAKSEFANSDLDSNGILTFEEFKYAPRGVFKPRVRFLQLDQDKNNGIELDEFLKQSNRVLLSQQTFAAFDRDKNGSMTFEEYAMTPHANPVGKSIMAITDENNDGRVSLDEFVRLETPTSRRLKIAQFEMYDLDQSGALTADEFSFPVSWNSFPTPSLFDQLDQNDDDRVTFGEMFPNPGNRSTQRKSQFAALDRNGDDFVVWDELKLNNPGTRQANGPKGKRPTFTDGTGGTPMGWIHPEDRPSPPDAATVFKQKDKNQDQNLSLHEYAGVSRAKSVKAAFSYFDLDGDQSLTFEEFRSTPLANPDAETLLAGLDRDGVAGLTFAEFVGFRASQATDRLQRIFDRFDSNADGKLSDEEFRATPDAHPTSDIILSSRDGNADGKLDLAEFADVAGGPNTRESKHFEALDLNRDGYLTLAELKLNDPAPSRVARVGGNADHGRPETAISTTVIVLAVTLAAGLVFLAFMLGRHAASR